MTACRDHLESKAKLASKKLVGHQQSETVLHAKTLISSNRAHVRPHMEYCSHLYLLEPFDRIQLRAVRIIRDPTICERQTKAGRFGFA